MTNCRVARRRSVGEAAAAGDDGGSATLNRMRAARSEDEASPASFCGPRGGAGAVLAF